MFNQNRIRSRAHAVQIDIITPPPPTTSTTQPSFTVYIFGIIIFLTCWFVCLALGCNCLLFDKPKSSHLSKDTKLIIYFMTQCDTIQNLLNLEENVNDDVNFFTHVNSKYYDKHDLRFILSQQNTKFWRIPYLNDIKISDYKELIFEPTTSTFSGTSFYIKRYSRNDLQISSPSNHESKFVEIIFPNRKNLIVGCIYRWISVKCIWILFFKK